MPGTVKLVLHPPLAELYKIDAIKVALKYIVQLPIAAVAPETPEVASVTLKVIPTLVPTEALL